MKKISLCLMLLLMTVSTLALGKSYRGDDFAPFPLRSTQLNILKGSWLGEGQKLVIHDMSYSEFGRPVLFLTLKKDRGRALQGFIYYDSYLESYVFYTFSGVLGQTSQVSFYKTKQTWFTSGSSAVGGCRSIKILMEIGDSSFIKRQCF